MRLLESALAPTSFIHVWTVNVYRGRHFGAGGSGRGTLFQDYARVSGRPLVIGEFGVDSFEIFARGDVRRKPKDCNLQAFCAWQKRHGNVADEDDKENVKVKIEH